MYASRGCATTVKHDDLLSHHEECGFAPVHCSHDGCEVTVNKQDVVGHQANCEFRLVTCEECLEAMKQRDCGKHICVLRKELDETKHGLAEVWKVLREIQGEQKRQGEEMREMAREFRQPNAVDGQRASKARQQPKSQASQTSQAESNDDVASGSCVAANDVDTLPTPSPVVRQAPVETEIFVAGGSKKRSCEIFNWSTQKWTLHKDMLFFDHTDGFSFLYETVDEVQFYEWIMICGGTATNRIECLNIADCNSVSAFPAQLRGTKCGKGVLCGDKILTFGYSVLETALRPQFETTKLYSYEKRGKLSRYGVAYVNQNAVVIFGGIYSYYGDNFRLEIECKNSVKLYSPTTKTMKTLAPLPYKLCDMTAVAHEDRVIILGGSKNYGDPINEVLMYNVTNQHCLRLPSMLEAR